MARQEDKVQLIVVTRKGCSGFLINTSNYPTFCNYSNLASSQSGHRFFQVQQSNLPLSPIIEYHLTNLLTAVSQWWSMWLRENLGFARVGHNT